MGSILEDKHTLTLYFESTYSEKAAKISWRHSIASAATLLWDISAASFIKEKEI